LTLSELIKDVKRDAVLAQAFEYVPRNWTSYPDLPAALLKAGYTGHDVQNGFSVTRQKLRDMFAISLNLAGEHPDLDLLAAAIVVVPVWGYPGGVVGPGNRTPINAVHEHRHSIAQAFARFARGEASTKEIVKVTTHKHIGLSTLSKLLYFAGIASREGTMLIYDQMVMRALHFHSFDEYGEWPQYAGYAQRATYAAFILKTAEAAKAVGCEPELIEYALFKEGQRLGPDRKVEKITEEPEVIEAEIRTPGAGTIEKLPTFAGRSTFKAEFHDGGDVMLHYGKNDTEKTVPRKVLIDVANYFRGATIPLTATKGPSLNEWLLTNFSPIWLASYVGPVLLRLGYAVRVENKLHFPLILTI
jgi:hypothetical protein